MSRMHTLRTCACTFSRQEEFPVHPSPPPTGRAMGPTGTPVLLGHSQPVALASHVDNRGWPCGQNSTGSNPAWSCLGWVAWAALPPPPTQGSGVDILNLQGSWRSYRVPDTGEGASAHSHPASMLRSQDFKLDPASSRIISFSVPYAYQAESF